MLSLASRSLALHRQAPINFRHTQRSQLLDSLHITQHAQGARVQIRVKPRASRSAILSVADDGILIVALAAPPVDGAANAELLEFLAHSTDLPKRCITLVAGQKSRVKLVQFAGLEPGELTHRLQPPSPLPSRK